MNDQKNLGLEDGVRDGRGLPPSPPLVPILSRDSDLPSPSRLVNVVHGEPPLDPVPELRGPIDHTAAHIVIVEELARIRRRVHVLEYNYGALELEHERLEQWAEHLEDELAIALDALGLL